MDAKPIRNRESDPTQGSDQRSRSRSRERGAKVRLASMPAAGNAERFRIGAEVAGTDGTCGTLTGVIIDPVARALFYLRRVALLVVRSGRHGRKVQCDRLRDQTDIRGLILKTRVRRGSPSESGRGRRSRLPIVLSRAFSDGDGPSWVLVLAPAAFWARSWVGRSGIEGGGLPEERGELAGDRDRDHAGGLASLVSEVLPAACRRRCARQAISMILGSCPCLAASRARRRCGAGSVVVGGLDQQPAGVPGSGFGDRSLVGAWCQRCARRGRSRGSPTAVSASRTVGVTDLGGDTAAVSVSIPRKHRSLAITCACELSGICCSSVAISVWRRPHKQLNRRRGSRQSMPASTRPRS